MVPTDGHERCRCPSTTVEGVTEEKDDGDKPGCGFLVWILVASVVTAIIWQVFESDTPAPDYFTMDCESLFDAMRAIDVDKEPGTANLIRDEIAARC